MKFLLPLLRNNILQLSHANQLRYADTKNRTKTITLYMLIAAILMGLLAYLIYSLKIIYSIAWSLEEVVTELVIPMVLICVSLNIAISVFWGSGSYSHGMKQKLALIAAFSHTPKLLILDEPFVGLDPEAFVILKEQMKELCASGNSVLFSSHILDVVEKVCNKVSVIKHGQLLYSGRTTEIVGTKGLEEVFMEMNGDEISVTPTKE